MTGKCTVLLLTALLASTSGCHCGPTASTVPWWKGLPCMVIAPSSIEAEAWRRRCRAAHSRRHPPQMATGDDPWIQEEYLPLDPESLDPESLDPESLEPESLEPESLEPERGELESIEPQGLEREPREGDVFIELPDGSLQLMPPHN